jgi:hypothetical protein
MKWDESGELELSNFPITEPETRTNALFAKTEMQIGSGPVEESRTGGTGQPKGWIYVWGIVRYDDGFSPTTRFTRFCHRYPCSAGAVPEITDMSFRVAFTHDRYHEHGNEAD